MNYYERHIGDYLKNTAHLSLLEHGVYTRLMDVYYTREDGIPADQAARLVGARSKDEHAALANVIDEFFAVDDGVLRQARCDAEIERYQKKAAHNREVGKLGGRPRKSETHPVQQQEPTNNPGGFQTEPTNNPPQYPVTSNQTPVTKKSREAARGSRLPTDFEPDFAFAVDQGIANTLEEASKFRDYWSAQPGQRGVKTDWNATWRNWCRNAKKPASASAQGAETGYQRTMREKWEVATGRNKHTEAINGDAKLLG